MWQPDSFSPGSSSSLSAASDCSIRFWPPLTTKQGFNRSSPRIRPTLAFSATLRASLQNQRLRRLKKSQPIEMFESMRTEAPWDVDSDLLWGYFFTGRDKKKLNQLAKKLVSLGYRLVKTPARRKRPRLLAAC